MRSFTKMGVGIVAAAVMGGGASAALADQVHVPYPPPNQQACEGMVIGAYNNLAGSSGPSGNPAASSGPGSFFGPGTHSQITIAREGFCG